MEEHPQSWQNYLYSLSWTCLQAPLCTQSYSINKYWRMALSSCRHMLLLVLYRILSCLLKSTSSLWVSACSAVNKFRTMFGVDRESDRDTPALFYRFPITASIHYMCQTIYHDSKLGPVLSPFAHTCESCNVLYYHYRFVIFTAPLLMMITFLALSIIVLDMSERQSPHICMAAQARVRDLWY